MAPDRHEATQSPHPLQRAALISAFPANLPSSKILGAEYGQIETQTLQPLHTIGLVEAISPFVLTVPRANRVTALEAAAFA